MREIESMFPVSNTVYDYYINNEKNEYVLWEDKIGAVWKPPKNNIPFHEMFVPTTDTTRNYFNLQVLIK
jgi:dynein heavy chain